MLQQFSLKMYVRKLKQIIFVIMQKLIIFEKDQV